MRYRIHEFELDVEGGQLIGPTGVVPLRRQVLLTLCHLLQRAPDLVPNDELLDAVWGRQAISPNVVPQAMRELRRAFGDDAREPRFIETRHRLGYRFIAPVQRINGAVPGASADAPAASMPEADSARALPASSRPEPRAARSTWRTVLLACTVIAFAGVAAVLLYPGRQIADSGRREEAADLAQEVFVRVYERLETFRFESSFATWLYLVTRSVTINRSIANRRRDAESIDDENFLEPAAPGPSVEESVGQALLVQQLRQAIAADLEPLEAQILHLHFVDGLTLATIDQMLELGNKSGARAYLVSAKRKLQRSFSASIPKRGLS